MAKDWRARRQRVAEPHGLGCDIPGRGRGRRGSAGLWWALLPKRADDEDGLRALTLEERKETSGIGDAGGCGRVGLLLRGAPGAGNEDAANLPVSPGEVSQRLHGAWQRRDPFQLGRERHQEEELRFGEPEQDPQVASHHALPEAPGAYRE